MKVRTSKYHIWWAAPGGPTVKDPGLQRYGAPPGWNRRISGWDATMEPPRRGPPSEEVDDDAELQTGVVPTVVPMGPGSGTDGQT